MRAEICKRDFKQFILEFWNEVESAKFIDGWVIDAFVDHLTHLPQIGNLLINCPPNTGKSLLVNVLFPAWRWASDPTDKFLTGSYSLTLAERDSSKARRLIMSDKYQSYFPHVRLSSDQNAKGAYINDKGGERKTTATGAAVAGFKGDVLILDDPHNTNEADSDVKRDEAVKWFPDYFYNRLNDFTKGQRVVIGQRIHQRDLSGFILENFPDWIHLNLPWEYKPTNYVSVSGWKDPRTEVGQPLWSERYPQSEINNLKRRPVSFAAQWNQAPVGGNELSPFNAGQFKYFTETSDSYKTNDKEVLKDNTFCLIACDPAYSESRHSDFSVVVVADISPSGDIFLKDMVRQRIGVTKLIPVLKRLEEVYHPIYTLIENVTIGGIVCQQARESGVHVKPIKTKRGSEAGEMKTIRSLDLQLALEDGKLYLPLGRDWVPVVEAEILDFPNSSFDDIVDALSFLSAEARHRTRYGRQYEYAAHQDRSQNDIDKRIHQMMWGD